MTQGLTQSDIVISVCPPHAAVAQAQLVAESSFDGLYVDANAVSPSTASEISTLFSGRYIDGGIIGPPAHKPSTTRLYVSGPEAGVIKALFEGSNLGCIVLDARTNSASSLKMCYAGYTKGTAALILNLRTLATNLDVSEFLDQEWDISQPDLRTRAERAALGNSRKAWRFEGEMREIASTYLEAGLTDQFHLGAAEVYRRMAPLKDKTPTDLAGVIQQISEFRDTD